MTADIAVPEVDLTAVDFSIIVADLSAIRAVNPHRHEMEMVTAVVHIDPATHTIVGYKDLLAGDFWTRGHFPSYPVFPGVLMCEAAAQISNYYTVSHGIISKERLMGLAGLEDVRFREMVRPGDRLVLAARGIRLSSRLTKFATRGYVTRAGKFELAFEATVIGVPLGKWEDILRAETAAAE